MGMHYSRAAHTFFTLDNLFLSVGQEPYHELDADTLEKLSSTEVANRIMERADTKTIRFTADDY